MRRKLIAGNWKMNLNPAESGQLARKITEKIDKKVLDKIDVLLCPTFISLETVSKIIQNTGIKLGAQNLYFQNDGAFTGEISAKMLKDVGCEYVIIGHSERRKLLHETNKMINDKIRQALLFDLKIILCVGETFEEREDEIYEAVIDEQLGEGLDDISKSEMSNITIAYEPVWAIGTGLNATPEQASKMHGFISEKISRLYDKETAEKLLILYGGSVNEKNSKDMLSACGVDGALIGGASLKADEFAAIAKLAAHI